MSTHADSKPWTVPALAEAKRNGQKLVMLTAYDAGFARAFDANGVDLILIGDSLGMVVQGHDSTLPVTVADIAYHTTAVARVLQRALLVADLPFGADATPERAFEASLQLLRAGNVLLVVELPTGESFQSRDPAYILLKDLLRAARLPDKPQQVGDGEPIRWPLLHKGSLDQGAEAARDYVQGVMAAELEQMGCDCIWLIGRPALRFAGEVDVDNCYREVAVEGLGRALAMPGLEALMEQPAAKAELWKAMRRSMPRWHIGS